MMPRWLNRILFEKQEILNDIYMFAYDYFKNELNKLKLESELELLAFKDVNYIHLFKDNYLMVHDQAVKLLISLKIKSIDFALDLVSDVLTIINEYKLLEKNIEIQFYFFINKSIELIKIYYTKKNIFEFRIYIYNKTVLFKKLKYKIKLIILYFICPVEFLLKKNIKFYCGTNIARYHKKVPSFTLIEGKLQNQIEEFNTQLRIEISIIIENLIEKYEERLIDGIKFITPRVIIKFNDRCLEIDIFLNKLQAEFNSYIKFIMGWVITKINSVFKFIEELDTKTVNKNFKYIYTPINLFNFLISDICLTIMYVIIKLKKKWIIVRLSMYIFNKIIIKINYRLLLLILNIIKKIFRFIYWCVSYIIYFLISKTMYITIVYAYFYSEDALNYLLYENFYLYYRDIMIYINSNKHALIINILLNENLLAFLWPFACLQLILFWARRVHDYYGNTLWTMTIFPMYLESYKIWYNKLICLNFFNHDVFEWALLLRYDILKLFNYKVFNIYSLTTSLILIYLFIYFMRNEAYDYTYGHFNKSRRQYIKYPAIICLLEIFRNQIILYSSTYILYFNYKFKLHRKICSWICNIKKNYVPSYYYPMDHGAFINWETMNLANLLIPNPFIINFIIDITMVCVAACWIFKYTKKFVKIDVKFVASPIVALELFIARITGMYICLYAYFYWFTWLTDLRLYVYMMYYVVFSYFYFVFRSNIIPRKTMPWYFRNIVELWPSTYFNQWSSIELMYDDQVRYVALRFKLKEYKEEYKRVYKQVEVWHKMIILKYQWQKDSVLRLVVAYCRIMARKELMMREFNNYEYQGWYEDWEFNHKKINIYSWKLDAWDKPHIYMLIKTGAFVGVKLCFFHIGPILESYSNKYVFLRILVIGTKLLDTFYTNKCIFIFESTDDNTQRRIEWRDKVFKEGAEYEALWHLKHLKRVLMEFSSGERAKTPDWHFPHHYAKEYKKKGWDMFKDPRIDLITFDWRPKFKNLD